MASQSVTKVATKRARVSSRTRASSSGGGDDGIEGGEGSPAVIGSRLLVSTHTAIRYGRAAAMAVPKRTGERRPRKSQRADVPLVRKR